MMEDEDSEDDVPLCSLEKFRQEAVLQYANSVIPNVSHPSREGGSGSDSWQANVFHESKKFKGANVSNGSNGSNVRNGSNVSNGSNGRKDSMDSKEPSDTRDQVDPKNACQAKIVEALVDSMTCKLCYNVCKTPIMQCERGCIVCNECRDRKDDSGKCPFCRCFDRVLSRNITMENMARLMPWACSGASLGCGETMEYDDIVGHEQKCRFTMQYMCPIAACREQLGYGALSILKHLLDEHDLKLEVLESDATRFYNLRLDVHDFSSGNMPSYRQIYTSKIFLFEEVYYILMFIETANSIKFRTTFFTDRVLTDKVMLEKQFIGNDDDKILVRERVKPLSDMRWLSVYRRSTPMPEILDIKSNSNNPIDIEKNSFDKGFFQKDNSDSNQIQLRMGIRFFFTPDMTGHNGTPQSSPSYHALPSDPTTPLSPLSHSDLASRASGEM